MAVTEVGERGRAALFGLMVVTAALLACAGADDVNERYKPKLVTRAHFDLNCPDKLRTMPLEIDDAGVIKSYGVAGCGKRATYVLAPDGTWLMNSGQDAKPEPKATPSVEPEDDEDDLPKRQHHKPTKPDVE